MAKRRQKKQNYDKLEVDEFWTYDGLSEKTCCFSKKLFNHFKAFDLAFFYINYGFVWTAHCVIHYHISGCSQKCFLTTKHTKDTQSSQI